MKEKSLFIALLLLLCTTITYAQNDTSFKTITLTASRDTVFDKIIDYLQTTDMFIQSVDKQAGFIQAKVFLKDNKFLSAKLGEKRILNFFLRATANKTRVMLNIYSEYYYYGGNYNAYSEDKGVVKDASVYKDILSNLQTAIDQ